MQKKRHVCAIFSTHMLIEGSLKIRQNKNLFLRQLHTKRGVNTVGDDGFEPPTLSV